MQLITNLQLEALKPTHTIMEANYYNLVNVENSFPHETTIIDK